MSSFLDLILLTAVGTIAVSDGVNVVGVNSDGSINVRVVSGGGSGSNAAAGPTGVAVPADADYQGVNVGGTLRGVTGLSLGSVFAPTIALVDGSGNQITTFGGGQQYADSAASGGAPTGTLSMGWDSANSKIRALKVDTSQNLLIAFGAPQHIIVDSGSIGITGTVDVSDRAARLLGVIYGSQGQQVKQTPVNFNLQVELATGAALYDARQIRALVPSDTLTLAAGPNLIGAVNLEVSNVPLTITYIGSPAQAALNVNVANTSPIPVNLEVSGTPLSFTFAGSPAVAALNVNVENAVSVSGSVAVSNFPTTQTISGAVDVSDRAARLLGVIYGSQGQQVKQTPVNFNLQVELATGAALYDARQIRALVPSDTLTLAAGPNLIGAVNLEVSNVPLTITYIGSPAQAALNVNVANTSPIAVNLDISNTPLSFTFAGSPAVASLNVNVQNAVSVSFSAPQHVIVDSGAGAGTQYADSAASGATPTGTLAMAWDSTNSKVRALKVDASQDLLVALPYDARQIRALVASDTVTLASGSNIIGAVNLEVSNVPLTITYIGSPAIASLNVNVLNTVPIPVNLDISNTPLSFTFSGSPAVASLNVNVENLTQYADLAASGATPSGTLAMGWDSANAKIRAVRLDKNQNLQVVVNSSLPAGANLIGAVNIEVNNTPLTAVVYGSPAQTALAVWVANMDSPLRTVKSLTLTTTAVSQLIQGVAGTYRDLSYLQASNTSATNVRIDISDGTVTYSWMLAASGGGFNINFDPPLMATGIGQGWTAAISAGVTDVRVSAQAVTR